MPATHPGIGDGRIIHYCRSPSREAVPDAAAADAGELYEDVGARSAGPARVPEPAAAAAPHQGRPSTLFRHQEMPSQSSTDF